MVLEIIEFICMTIGVFYTLVFYAAIFLALITWANGDKKDHNNRRKY